jgi:hypothetical protein
MNVQYRVHNSIQFDPIFSQNPAHTILLQSFKIHIILPHMSRSPEFFRPFRIIDWSFVYIIIPSMRAAYTMYY